MQNWDSLQPANYELNWYSNTFGTRNDSHPTSTTTMNPITTTIEQCFNNLKQQTQTGMDITSSPISSPRNSDCQDMNYLDNSNETITTIASNTNHQHHHQNHHNHHHSHNHNHPLGFNPLTPPGLPNAVLPSMNFRSSDLNHDPSEKHENQLKIDDNSLTPRNTPPVDVTPPKSPKNFNNHDTTLDNDMMSNSSEDTRFLESEDDDQIRVPIYNSHGKMKNYKCKHCGFTAITKISFWNHAREHMKPEKMLQCPKCPFVTELKHHLEYHIRKHKNLKPFQCDKCNYSCVNKSMLNSHLKSHSSVYQYRCSDCDYATKYCHSFKLHLRKYEHKPGMVLDEDGSPNPSVVIDVYGTRRGPKMKSGKSRSKTSSRKTAQSTVNKSLNSATNDKTTEPKNTDSGQMTPKLPCNEKNIRNSTSNILPNNLANMLHQTRNMSFLPYFNLNLQMIAAQQHAAWTQISPQIQQNMFRPSNEDSLSEMQKIKDPKELSDEENSVEQKCNIGNDAMDLSHNTLVKANVLIHSETQTYQEKVKEEHNVPTITSSSCNRSGGGGSGKRKCRKIDHHQMEKNSINGKLQQQPHDTVKIDCSDNNITTKNSYPIYESKTELPSSSQDDIKVSNSNSNENSDKNSSPTLSTSSTATSSSALSASTSTSTAADCSTSPQTPQNPVQNNNFQIPGIFECKYCDIYFKDAVLYTIHMGYHSCDDVFKCNMCGEKCDGPVGLFIHMARNPHS